MNRDEKHTLPSLTPDGFSDWGDVSVARAIAYTNVKIIARHLKSRENFDPELSDSEIEKMQLYLYNECLSPDEQGAITFDEFAHGKRDKK